MRFNRTSKYNRTPWLFYAVFTFIAVVALAQFVIVGWGVYYVMSDPIGSATSIGNFVSAMITPIIDALGR